MVAAVGLFIVWNVLLNSKVGAVVEEAMTDWAVRSWRQLHKRVLPGLISLIADIFRRALDAMDRAIYAVDELLRFRQGESQFTLVVKGTLGVIWFFVTYLIRIYVNLLVEPEVNPIKHFPVVTVAAKIMIPVTPPIHGAMGDALRPLLGGFLAESIAAPTVFLLPGFFGFLVWELKENWRLYRMNRLPHLAPVLIGHHGETMVAFMKPGFHSGTIPKVYAKMRRAAWKGARAQHKHKEALHHVADSIARFTERELIALLEMSGQWTSGHLTVGHIDIASNRVRVEIKNGTQHPLIIAFEEQTGWLLGSVHKPGWIDALDEGQRLVLENALAGYYKMAGVDLVREQVIACLGDVPFDVTEQGLIVWPDGSWSAEVVYDLEGRGILKGTVRQGAASPVPVEAKKLIFRDEKITWTAWVEAWRQGAPPTRLVSGPPLLPPRHSVVYGQPIMAVSAE